MVTCQARTRDMIPLNGFDPAAGTARALVVLAGLRPGCDRRDRAPRACGRRYGPHLGSRNTLRHRRDRDGGQRTDLSARQVARHGPLRRRVDRSRVRHSQDDCGPPSAGCGRHMPDIGECLRAWIRAPLQQWRKCWNHRRYPHGRSGPPGRLFRFAGPLSAPAAATGLCFRISNSSAGSGGGSSQNSTVSAAPDRGPRRGGPFGCCGPDRNGQPRFSTRASPKAQNQPAAKAGC